MIVILLFPPPGTTAALDLREQLAKPPARPHARCAADIRHQDARRSARVVYAVGAFGGKMSTVDTLNFDMRSLYLLAAPSTPDEARETLSSRGLDRKRREAGAPVDR
jgi:hypothetical protein